MGRSKVMTEQPQEPSDTMGGDDSDVYTIEDKPCGRCDEYHDVDNCGRDTADPDVLYDEMHTLD